MRKSTGITMTIIVLAFGGMMLAANVALKPLKRYAEIASEVTDILHNLEMIEPKSKVFVLARNGGDEHMAKEGWGMLVELTPSEAVRSTEGRMRRLAFRAIQEVRRLYERGEWRDLDWFEIKLVPPEGDPHRSLIAMSSAGSLGRPEPAIPTTFGPPALVPPKAPPRTSRLTPPEPSIPQK